MIPEMTIYETFQKMKPLVGNPAWDVYEKYLKGKKEEIRDSIETCPPESLKGYQGQLCILNELLKLKEDVVRLNS